MSAAGYHSLNAYQVNALQGLVSPSSVSTVSVSTSLAVNQLVGGIVSFTGTAADNLTTPTATAVLAAYPLLQVGSTFRLLVLNNGTAAATLVGGTGVTVTGSGVVGTGASRTFIGVVTNVATPAITIY